MTDEDILSDIHETFDVPEEEIDIDVEGLEQRLEESPDGEIKAEMDVVSEVWEERISNEEDTEELEYVKERIDIMRQNFEEFEDSVEDLQGAAERDVD